jgi:hypothetical protein
MRDIQGHGEGAKTMRWYQGVVATVAVVLAFGGATPRLVPPAQAACDPGDRLDRSTADEARRKMEQAGYHHVHDLMKGCDNVWQAAADRDGQPVMVALLPRGEVVRDGH